MQAELYKQLEGVTAKLMPLMAKHDAATSMLQDMRSDPNGRHRLHEIQEQRGVMNDIERKIEPLRERERDLTALLPPPEQRHAAILQEAELVALLEQTDVAHDPANDAYIEALRTAKIAADTLLEVRLKRRDIVTKLSQLRADFRLPRRIQRYLPTHTAEREREAFHLASYLGQAATGFVSAILIRDLK